MFRRAPPRAFEERRRRAALAVSIAAHVAIGVLLLPQLARERPARAVRPEMVIVAVDRDAIPALRRPAEPAPNQVGALAVAPTPAPTSREPAPNQVPAPRLDSGQVPRIEGPAVAGDPGTGSPSGDPAGSGPDYRGVLKEREREAIAEALDPRGNRLVPWVGAPGTPGGPRQPTDSIDGRPRLGTGEPGDPLIPGSGGVDIAKVVTRDGVVAQAQERARQGNVHPFLGEVKDRVETCWLPVVADANALAEYELVEDPVCAKGYHVRRKAGRVFTIHDPSGTRLAMEIDTGPGGAAQTIVRGLRDKIRRAFEDAGMKEVPVELLDDRGLLRLAWNVYIDDYRGCNLMGRGANAHKPGGDEIIGIVELDGVY